MKRGFRYYCELVALVLTAMMLLQSCSVKKNRAATRRYHAFVTRYNVLYNGETRYREAVDDMITTFKDNDSTILAPHPADVMEGNNSPRFDYSIDKARKAITLHSITSRPRGKAGRRHDPEYRKWMSRKEYNQALADAWLLLGNCYFMKGRFDDAALVFAAAELRFAHDSHVVAVCRIMQARCRADMGWNFEAAMMLERVDFNLLKSRQSKYLYYSTRSIIEANEGNNDRAAESALTGAEYAPNRILASRLKQRATMLRTRYSHLLEKDFAAEFVLPDSVFQYVNQVQHNESGTADVVIGFDIEPDLPFKFARDVAHQVVFTFDTDVVEGNKLIYEIACFNFAKYDTDDFDINRVDEKISVGQFDNYDSAQSYIKMFVESNSDLMNKVRLTPVSTADLELMSGYGIGIESYMKARAEAWSINENN
ncbi:MAG: hypothetical protein K2H59_03940 [Muribaculaceae bacterium]|nr:hypothetical protein [Muribaculaceae bacterium]